MYTIWFGSEQSYNAVLDAKVKVAAMLKGSSKDVSKLDMPSTYRLEGDVGIVSVSGSLVDGSAGWMQLFGITGYDDIAAGLIEAVSDKKAKSIMLDVNSPGGSAKGVRQLGDLTKNVADVKSMTVYADGIGSAAYWLGSAGGHITLEEMGMAGSIGALIVHTDVSGALAKDGIKKEIIRAGVNKMLANPIEPLSEAGRAELQQIVDDSRDMFVRAVADNRRTTPTAVEANMGQGKMFMGVRALSVGLVDSIGSFEDALQYSKEARKSFKAVKV